MYRLVLEHPEWIPAEITKGLHLRAGEDMGRIYREAKTGVAKPVWPDFSKPVKAMDSPNGWVRDTAMRLIVESFVQEKDPDAPAVSRKGSQRFKSRLSKEDVDSLNALAANGPKPAARIHALWTVALMGELDLPTSLMVIGSADDRVLAQALLCGTYDHSLAPVGEHLDIDSLAAN